jgi:hypothetical protein
MTLVICQSDACAIIMATNLNPTPVKYYDKTKCFICHSDSKKYVLIERSYGAEKKLSEVILKCLDVNVFFW